MIRPTKYRLPCGRRSVVVVLVFCSLLSLGIAALVHGQDSVRGQTESAATAVASRFGWVDVYIDAPQQSLAAYQFEFAAEVGQVNVVGIEGGDAAAFKAPPYYDTHAMHHNRVILAAFSTGADLPLGHVRVARVNIEIRGDVKPQYVARLQASADAEGTTISKAAISLTEGSAQ